MLVLVFGLGLYSPILLFFICYPSFFLNYFFRACFFSGHCFTVIFHFFLIYWLFFFDTIINGSFAFLFCALFYIPFPTRSCFLFSFHRLRGLVILNTGFASHPFLPLDPLVPICGVFMYLLRQPQFGLFLFILAIPFSSCS